MVRKNWKIYALWITLTLAVGGLSALLTMENTMAFQDQVAQPPLSPPAWLFPVVWTVLYVLMGISAARVSLTEVSAQRDGALRLYGVQLGFNFFWSILFFNMASYGLALLWLLVLWVLILAMILSFRRLDKWAGYLQIPYLVWVTFAAYLNFGVWRLN